jgi:hypothetical protein
MDSTNLYLIFVLAFLALLCYYTYTDKTIMEGWVNYQQLPFGNYYTAADDPVILYTKPVYRQPYMWPACHMINYPTPHCQSLSN